MTGADCTCSETWVPMAGVNGGSYSTSGTTLHLVESGSVGDIGIDTAEEYCVNGDVLDVVLSLTGKEFIYARQ